LQRCGREVVGQLDKLAKATDLDDAKKAKFKLGALQDLAEGELAAYMSDAGEQAAADILAEIGLDEDDAEDGKMFNVVNRRAIEAVRARGAELVSQVSEATRNMLRRTIAGALEDNVDRKELVQRIMDSDAFGHDRAELIAHQEIRQANETGVLQGLFGARDAGNKVLKYIILGPDPCEVCLDNESVGPIELDDEWPSGDDAAPFHVNCLCAISGQIVEDDDDDEEKVAKVWGPAAWEASAEVRRGALAGGHPDYVYHGTSDKNLADIRRNGFKPGSYFTTHPVTASDEAHFAVEGDRFSNKPGAGGKPVVLAVRRSDLAGNHFQADPEYSGNEEDFGRAAVSKERVKAEAIAEELDGTGVARHAQQIKSYKLAKVWGPAAWEASAEARRAIADDEKRVAGPFPKGAHRLNLPVKPGIKSCIGQCAQEALKEHKESGADVYVGTAVRRDTLEPAIANRGGLYAISHAWNVKDGQIIDRALGSREAKDYVYFGAKVPDDVADSIKPDELASWHTKQLEKGAEPEAKGSMADANYVDQSPYDDARCGTCAMYQPRQGMMLGNCSKVAGDDAIDLRGWCEYYSPDQD
jgi:High potential iron-sulfur protein